MTDEDRKLLTEAMGECWHELEYDRDEGHSFCKLCGDIPAWPNRMHRTFDNWNDFGVLWEWASKQDWWLDMVAYFEGDANFRAFCLIDTRMIDPIKFAEATVKKLREAKP